MLSYNNTFRNNCDSTTSNKQQSDTTGLITEKPVSGLPGSFLETAQHITLQCEALAHKRLLSKPTLSANNNNYYGYQNIRT